MHRATWGKHIGEFLLDGSILIYNCRFKSILTLMDIIDEKDDYTEMKIGFDDYALYNISKDEIYDVVLNKWIRI